MSGDIQAHSPSPLSFGKIRSLATLFVTRDTCFASGDTFFTIGATVLNISDNWLVICDTYFDLGHSFLVICCICFVIDDTSLHHWFRHWRHFVWNWRRWRRVVGHSPLVSPLATLFSPLVTLVFDIGDTCLIIFNTYFDIRDTLFSISGTLFHIGDACFVIGDTLSNQFKPPLRKYVQSHLLPFVGENMIQIHPLRCTTPTRFFIVESVRSCGRR